MFFDSSEYLEQTSSKMDVNSIMRMRDIYTPGIGEAAAASVGSAWDRSMGARWIENWQLGTAERKAIATGTAQIYANQEEFEASDYFAPGMEFTEGMNSERARLMRQAYDLRRRREAILNAAGRNGNFWLYRPVMFGAGMIGSLPDPINAASVAIGFIPVIGPALAGGARAGTAARAGLTGKQVFAQSLKPGVIGSAAAGNLISSAYAAYDLNPKGEDITFQDVMIDTMMGAAVGPLFHAGGTMISRFRARRGTRAQLDGLIAEGQRAEAPFDVTEMQKLAERMKKNDPEAYQLYGRRLEEWNQNFLRTENAFDYVRTRLKPGERVELSRWMEYALTEIAEGRPLDMAQITNTPQAIPVMTRMESLINEFRTSQNESPVVIESIGQAKAEWRAMESDFAALTGESGTVSLFAGIPEGHPAKASLERLQKTVEGVRVIFKEIDGLQAQKKTTLQNLRRAEAQLEDAHLAHNEFVDKYIADLLTDPYAQKYMKDMRKTIKQIESGIANARAKVADLNKQIVEKLGDIAPADRTRINYQSMDRPQPISTEPLRTSEATTRAGELREMGIDENGISDAEHALGTLSENERAELGALDKLYDEPMLDLDRHAIEGERINRNERVALQESNLIECILTAGALR